MPKDWEIEVPIPAGSSKADEERLIQAATDKKTDKKIDKDLDDMLGGFFK